MQEVFDKVIECLGNERLDSIIIQNEEYRQAEDAANVASSKMYKIGLSEEGIEAFEQCLAAIHSAGIVYNRLAYQQGMKDVASFFVSLTLGN